MIEDERVQTSSTQQQVRPGLGTGSGFSGLQLKLSPEPRVEQGHAQEVKPGLQRKRAHQFNTGRIL